MTAAAEMTPTVYDLVEYWSSYVADLEFSLNSGFCPEDWEAYRKDAEPFLVDMVSDFGKFPAGIEGDAAIDMARTAVRKYLGKE